MSGPHPTDGLMPVLDNNVGGCVFFAEILRRVAFRDKLYANKCNSGFRSLPHCTEDSQCAM